MQQKNLTHKTSPEQSDTQALWLKECAEFKELQKIKSVDVFEAFTICFKLRKWNSSRFCENTGLSQTIFSKIKNKSYKEGEYPSLQSIIAICLGLQIPLDYSIEILNVDKKIDKLDEKRPLLQIHLNSLRSFQH